MAKTKILIVEDERLVALSLRMEFEALGYAVCSPAFTGAQALDIAAREHPDVVLMDIKLPGEMDGIEAAQEIRARFGIPCAYTTGYEAQEIEERAKATAPIGYFFKPFDCHEIQVVIDEAVKKQDILPHTSCAV